MAQRSRRLRLGVCAAHWPVGEQSTALMITLLLLPCSLPVVEFLSIKIGNEQAVQIMTAAPCPLSVDLFPVLRVRRASYSL